MGPYRHPVPAREEPKSEYALYVHPSVSVTDRFRIAAQDYDIRAADIAGMESILAPLREKHFPTYEHCLRVGLLSGKIGEFLREDPRALFMPGSLHDAGKASVPVDLLGKTEGWTREDSEAMAPHVLRGYELVRGRFDYSADILVHHHRFQPHGYPSVVPEPSHDYSPGSRTRLEYFGRIVALADVYDALHRLNSRHDVSDSERGEQIKELMFQYNPDAKPLVDKLYTAGVFSTHLLGQPHAETQLLDENDVLYNTLTARESLERTPEETRRLVQLSCALEPLPDKGGCTGRSLDASRHLRIEYFVASAINIGDAFQALAVAAEGAEANPSGLYRYLEQAQSESKRNRRGGRINQGMIEFLGPIVVAQHLADRERAMTTDQVLLAAKDYLTKTSRRDVNSIIGLKTLAHELSHMEREVPGHADASTVGEYYEAETRNSTSATSLAHNLEFLRGFPSIKLVADTLQEAPFPHLNQNIEEAYIRLRNMHSPDVGRGLLADFIAVGTYLALSQDPQSRLIG